MPKRKIETEIELTGEAAYKKALDDATSSVKLLGLQVKENATDYKLHSDSVEGNRERVALLKKEIEEQQKVVAMYTERIEKNKLAGRENTSEQKRLEEGLIKAKTALSAMNNDLEVTNGKLPSMRDKVKEVSSHLGKGLVEGAKVAGKAVAAAMAAISAAAVSAGKAIFDLTGQAGTYADTILTMSQTTGVATEDLQKWEYASQFIDTSVDTITGSLTKLTKNMKSSSAETTEAFQTLGVSVTDSTGKMRDDQEVFWEIIDALGQVENETERDQLAMTLLGKSAQDLNPLIISGSDAFRQLGEDAKEAGLIMSDDSLAAFGAYDDAMNEMKSTLTAAGRSVAEVFLPATKEIISSVTEVVQAFIGMVQGTEGSTEKFDAAIGKMIDQVTSMIDDWLPKILEMGVNILMKLTDGLLKAIPKLTAALPKIINTLLDFIVNNLPQIIDSGIKIIVALAEGIIKSIPNLVAKLPEIIVAIVKGLASGVSALWDVGKQLIAGLWEGIKSMFASIKDGIMNFGSNVVGWFKGIFGIHSPSSVMRDQVGKMLGLGVAEGLLSEKNTVQNAMNNIIPSGRTIRYSVEGAANAARSALSARAASPAYSMINVGNNGEMSDSTMRKLSDAFVSALSRSGFADQVIVLNDREVGRYMRRGLEVGFV